jgi:hypothetical protein
VDVVANQVVLLCMRGVSDEVGKVAWVALVGFRCCYESLRLGCHVCDGWHFMLPRFVAVPEPLGLELVEQRFTGVSYRNESEMAERDASVWLVVSRSAD